MYAVEVEVEFEWMDEVYEGYHDLSNAVQFAVYSSAFVSA